MSLVDSYYGADLERVVPPTTKYQSLDTVVIHDLIVTDLNALFVQVGEPRDICVYADVVKITCANTIDLSKIDKLSIIARKLEASGTYLSFQNDNCNQADITIYADEIPHQLEIYVWDKGSVTNQYTLLKQDNAIGYRFDVRPTPRPTIYSALTPLSTFEGQSLEPGAPLYKLIRTQLEVCLLLAHEKPKESVQIFEWILKITAHVSYGSDTRLQSLMLLASQSVGSATMPENEDMSFVPPLSPRVYKDLLLGFLDCARQYETEYDRFIAGNIVTSMFQRYKNTSEIYYRLQSNAKQNYEQALLAHQEIEASLKIQKTRLSRALEGFDKNYEQAMFTRTAMSFIKVGFSVYSLCMGNLSAFDALEDFMTYEGLQKMFEKITNIFEHLKNMKVAFEQSKNEADISTTSSFVQCAIVFQQMNNQKTWEDYFFKCREAFAELSKRKVNGAKQCLNELDGMNKLIKAHTDSKAALIKADEELLRLTLQQKISADQATRFSSIVKHSEFDPESISELKQAFLERLLSIKHWLGNYHKSYKNAYRYWALTESSVQFSHQKSIAEIYEDQARMQEEFASTLDNFPHPPQPFQISIDFVKTSEIVQEFIKHKRSTFNIALDHPKFQKLGRVRLEEMRVLLKGPKSEEIRLEISNNGVYQDRLFNQQFFFTSRPFKRLFAYSTEHRIVIPAKIHPDIKDYYFEPTPFTQWNISMPENISVNVDLSNLTVIKVIFFGSGINDI